MMMSEWLAARRDYAEFIATTYAGAPGYLNLVSGDKIIEAGEFAGLTERERDTVPWVVMDKKMGVRRCYTPSDFTHYWFYSYRDNKDPKYAARVERERQKIREWAEKFGPTGKYSQAGFMNFQVTTPEQELARKAAYCWPTHPDDFALPYSQQRQYLNMVFAGLHGTGKTHLMAALFNYESAGEGGPVFIRWRDLVARFRAKDADTGSLYDYYGNGEIGWPDDMDGDRPDTLMIDDLGVGADAFSADVFGELIDCRETNGRATIVTTNMDRDELMKWLGERAMSRLGSGCHWVRFEGADFRLKPR